MRITLNVLNKTSEEILAKLLVITNGTKTFNQCNAKTHESPRTLINNIEELLI